MTKMAERLYLRDMRDDTGGATFDFIGAAGTLFVFGWMAFEILKALLT